jgi:uncharacterized membrane-anchored protein
MSKQVLADILLAAKSENILPAEALVPAPDERPLPVVILNAVGAWLAAIPLMLAVWSVMESTGVYFIGAVSIGLAVVSLRSQMLTLFLEQISVPVLLAGCALLAIGLFKDTSDQLASGLLVSLAAVLAIVIPRTWLRVLLGLTMVWLVAVPVLRQRFYEFGEFDMWLVLHACLIIWITTLALIESGKGVALADTIEAAGSGWVLAVLVGLALWSGMTFLLGASIGQGDLGEATISHDLTWRDALIRTGSFALAACAAAWLAYRWPDMRRPVNVGLSLVFLALAWLMPALGGVLLVLAIGAVGKRWRIAIAAAAAAAWIVGSFYYQLGFPFVTKAIILTAAAALLGAMAWLALRAQGTNGTVREPAAKAGWGAAGLGIGTAALAALLVANVGIWQNEALIAGSPPIFIELAPVDPRSLMQGDFMQLRFSLPSEPRETGRLAKGANRPHVVAHIDARGVATIKKIDDGSPLQANEILIELTLTRHGWTLASDAWYFKEGEATRWSGAKYGEFRVGSGGRALLVGMRGPALEAL